MGFFNSSDESTESNHSDGETDNSGGNDNPLDDEPVPEGREIYHNTLLKQAIRVTVETGAGENNLETLVSGYSWEGDRLSLKRPATVTPRMSYDKDTHDFYLECELRDVPYITMDMREFGDVYYELSDFVHYQTVVMVNIEPEFPIVQKWRTNYTFTDAVEENRLATEKEQVEFLEQFGENEEE